jgi:hypothetical protein
MIERGKYIGRLRGPPEDEAEHFYKISGKSSTPRSPSHIRRVRG